MLPDIYFNENYGKIYELNGDGKLKTYYLECEYGKVYYNFLMREILLPDKTGYYDIITPYGYSGPLLIDCDEKNKTKLILFFKEQFENYCMKNNIVAEFVKFHPLIKNHENMDLYMDINPIGNTVYIPLNSPDEIWNNLGSHCKKSIRRAEKNGIRIVIDKSIGTLENFMNLYTNAMKKNNAADYYLFSNDFFYNTFNLLKDNVFIFNSLYEDKIISSSLILKYKEYIHGYFSGSDYSYTHLGPNNLLRYKAALWGYENHCKYFHLGGGNESLMKFKQSFSKNGLLDLYIGKKIHNPSIYNELVEKWKTINNVANIDKINYFPIYRVNKPMLQ